MGILSLGFQEILCLARHIQTLGFIFSIMQTEIHKLLAVSIVAAATAAPVACLSWKWN